MNNIMTESQRKIKIKTKSVNLFYGNYKVLDNITFDIYERAITAITGPSGCGKSSLLRLYNRMNDFISDAKTEGEILLDGVSIYEKNTDTASLRRKVGMVFQKPNIFPMSIYDNIIIGLKYQGIKNKRELEAIVEKTLNQVALWDEVKDNLKKPGLFLAPEQQQRLCIARALAVKPEVLLMDEPCGVLDPESTIKIEELILELAKKYTVVIATKNINQTLRVSDMTVFMMIKNM